MRVIFLGTPEFAAIPLEALAHDARYQVVGVVTQPDRAAGRNRAPEPPVKRAAVRLGIPVFQPESLRDPTAVEQLAALRPDGRSVPDDSRGDSSGLSLDSGRCRPPPARERDRPEHAWLDVGHIRHEPSRARVLARFQRLVVELSCGRSSALAPTRSPAARCGRTRGAVRA